MSQTSIVDFFGAPLCEVNSLFQLIAFDRHHEDGLPDWLAGIRSIEQAPRWVALDREALPFHGTIDFIRDSEIAQRLRWIVDELNGAWSFYGEDDPVKRLRSKIEDGFYFELRSDALRYKMRWAALI